MEKNATLDCKGLSCPMPIVKLAQQMKGMEQGKVLELLADDVGSKVDVPAWCNRTGNEFLGMEEEEGIFKYYIKKA